MKKTIISSLLAIPFLMSPDALAQKHGKGYGKGGKGGKGYGHRDAQTSYGYQRDSNRYQTSRYQTNRYQTVSHSKPTVAPVVVAPVRDEKVTKMVKELRGTPGKVAHKKRSVEIHSAVDPRGLSGRRGNYEYEVDASCHLATTEVKFVQGSTSLADRASGMYLRNLAKALLDPELMRGRFVIEGHASAEGSHHSNRKLSQSRANRIFDYLVDQGVPAHRLIAVGHGETQARFPSVSPEYLLAQDRRVMVYKLVR